MKREKSFFPYRVVYFLGIGGIGMSALARYFKARGVEKVVGYDLTPSPLTAQLEQEGILIHYEDLGEKAVEGLDPSCTLVIYTPAIPTDLGEFVAFQKGGFKMEKRAQALGEAVAQQKLLAVAGTHGKTTTSSLLAHLLHEAVGTNAFLGGISANLNSNLLIDPLSNRVVAEADEYDRSFLKLYPHVAIVTATSPDHLDIYGSETEYKKGFAQFIGHIEEGGTLVYRKGAFPQETLPASIKSYSYLAQWDSTTDLEVADIYSDNLRIEGQSILFDWHFPQKEIHFLNLRLNTAFPINVENATGAIAVASLEGAIEKQIRKGLETFRGVKRRFEFLLNKPQQILIDDYAHHPEELRASILSIRSLFPNEPILGIFQPHLYSRTKDFFKDFATVLSLLDEVILLPIYPAREKPIEGVSSELILQNLSCKHKFLVEKESLLEFIENYPLSLPRVVITLGAGNIDRLVAPLANLLSQRRDA